jgi:hypothetical protein
LTGAGVWAELADVTLFLALLWMTVRHAMERKGGGAGGLDGDWLVEVPYLVFVRYHYGHNLYCWLDTLDTYFSSDNCCWGINIEIKRFPNFQFNVVGSSHVGLA